MPADGRNKNNVADLMKIISGLKRDNALLTKNTELFKNVFDTISSSVCLISPDHRIIFYNKATRSLVPEDISRVKNNFCFRLIHKTASPVQKCPMEIARATGKKETVVQRIGGKYYKISAEPIFDKKKKFLGIVHIVEDVTSEKEAKDKLISSEEKFRKTFNICPVLIIVSKAADGEIVEVNKTFTKATSLDTCEIKGKTLSEINIWVDNSRIEKYLANVTRNKRVTNQEFPFLGKKGELRWGLISGETVILNNDLFIISVITDFTNNKKKEQTIKQQNEEIQAQNEEYRKINEELTVAKDRAVESDRLKTAFLQNISHEIRTPMNGIMGFAQLLVGENVNAEKRKKYSSLLNDNCRQLLSIITNLVDISRIESGSVRVLNNVFNLNDVLDDIHNNFKGLTDGKSIKLILNKGSGDSGPVIETDETKLRQIIVNLLDNAVKFTRLGKVEFGYILKNDVLEFFVNDTGKGIPPAELKNIFNTFVQIDDKKQLRTGTGLGLAISKAFAGLLHGDLYVISKEGSGSSFRFTLPCKIKKTENDINNHNTMKHSQNPQKTVLIVEDEYSNYLFLEEILTNKNIKILHAETGKEAIEYCSSNSEIGIVLMDIKLPDINGLEVIRVIKSIRPGLPIVAQTAYAFSSDREKALSNGCDGYLSKPIIIEELFTIINKYLY